MAIDGGPPVRGTRIPQVAGVARWDATRRRQLLEDVAGEQLAVASSVLRLQQRVCALVAQGVVDTSGLNAWPSPDLDGVWVELPSGADLVEICEAIEQEGAAARPATDAPYLLLRVQPWFDLEEIDQTILCCLKVVHVVLGVHPPGMDIEEHLRQDAVCHTQFSAVATAAPENAPRSS